MSAVDSAAPASARAAPEPLEGGRLWLIAFAVAMGTFMQVLDGTIANVSIPTIAGDLGVSTSQGTWVITSFAVANGISVPLTGWLMTRYGVVRTFVAAVTLFVLASFLCGISWNLPSLILFRVLQGLGSGPMSPGSQTLLLLIFPPSRRGTGLAIWSMTAMVGPIMGPMLGGYISDNLSWEWIFLINVPIGLICAVVCWRGLAGRETSTEKLPVDTTGFMLLVLWVGALQVMLDTGKDADWFSSPAIVVEAIIAVAGFIAWLIWELTAEHPIVDVSLFRQRNFAVSVLVMCVGYAVFFGNNLVMPLWLQTQMGYMATWAGLASMPGGIVGMLATPFIVRLMNNVDARSVASFSFASLAVSYYMRSLYTPDANFVVIVLPQLLQGFGAASFFVALISLALDGIPQQRIPEASGLNNFARLTASSFAASIATTFWERGQTVNQTRLAETMGAGDPAFAQSMQKLQAAGLSAQQAAATVGQEVAHQAFHLSTIEFFRISCWLMLAMIPLIWLAKSTRSDSSRPSK